jgi:HPt (histidine-containing phosphotransfer) domain-containing protein
MGFDDYMVKPLDFSRLFTLIKKHLGKKEPKNSSNIPGTKKENPPKKKTYKIPDSISDEVLNIFFTDAEEKLKTILDVLKNDLFEIEIDKIKAIAHEYKGTASYFGLKNLERIAIELDEAFKRPDSMKNLKTITRKLMEILNDILISRP